MKSPLWKALPACPARSALVGLLALVALARGAGASPETSGFRRFALVVGANDGGASRIKLRYAATDAAAFSEVLTELGGVSPQDLFLLKEPSRDQFLAAMEHLRARIAEAAARGFRAEMLVYFSGHSDESGLMFGAEKLTYPEFRARIDAAPAKIRLAVVDACASGALTRLKGGSRLPAFSVDRSSDLSGYAFLTSSSGAESAQESDRIRASYFTHYLVTGLRGGADRNLDGKVTLGEAYEFAFQETLSQTEGSQAGAQHPSYDMRLTGTGDLVLTDLRGTSAGLVLDGKLQGRLFVRSSTGALVAELQKQPGRKVELGLEAGLYDLTLDQGDAFYRALIKVDSLAHQPVAFTDFGPVERERTRSRGASVDNGPAAAGEAFAPATAKASPAAAWIPARAAIVPAFGFPGDGSRPYSHNFSVNLLSGEAQDISGMQFSLGYSRALGEMDGVQFGLINASQGSSHGVQFGMLLNPFARSHSGLQLSLLENTADTLRGVQIAAVNYARSGKGVQAGALNMARSQTGIQAGLINIALESKGLQAGLLNYASRSESAVLGLASFIGNGMHDVETTVDEKSMLRTALLLGGPYNYNYVSFDMKARYPRHLWGGSAGLGIHLPRKPLFADADAGVGMVYNDQDWDNYSVHMRVRGLVGYAPMRYFSVFAGMSYNAEAWPGSLRPNLNPDRDHEKWGKDVQARRWSGFMLGVRI